MVRALKNYLPSSVRAKRSNNDVTLIENQGSSDTSAEAHSIGSMLFGMEICRILDKAIYLNTFQGNRPAIISAKKNTERLRVAQGPNQATRKIWANIHRLRSQGNLSIQSLEFWQNRGISFSWRQKHGKTMSKKSKSIVCEEASFEAKKVKRQMASAAALLVFP